MSEIIASPKVVPTLTKTDARELKTLVRRDTEILFGELESRMKEFEQQLVASFRVQEDAIEEEREQRAEDDQREADKATAGLLKKFTKLNGEIVSHLEAMAEEGWQVRDRYRNVTALSPHAYVVNPPSFSGLAPPEGDDSDFRERAEAIQSEKAQALESLRANYRDAARHLEVEEARMLRELTLNSITTEAARDFILDMPRVEDLLPAPSQVQALEGSE